MRLTVPALLLATLAGPLHAQRLAPRFASYHPWPATPTPLVPPQQASEGSGGSTGGAILGGLAGGAAGFFGGGLVGLALSGCEQDTTDTWAGFGTFLCRGAAFAVGAVVGETIGLPVGAHLGGGRRGKVAWKILASAVILTGGAVLADKTDSDAVAILIPVGQLAAMVAMQR